MSTRNPRLPALVDRYFSFQRLRSLAEEEEERRREALEAIPDPYESPLAGMQDKILQRATVEQDPQLLRAMNIVEESLQSSWKRRTEEDRKKAYDRFQELSQIQQIQEKEKERFTDLLTTPTTPEVIRDAEERIALTDLSILDEPDDEHMAEMRSLSDIVGQIKAFALGERGKAAVEQVKTGMERMATEEELEEIAPRMAEFVDEPEPTELPPEPEEEPKMPTDYPLMAGLIGREEMIEAGVDIPEDRPIDPAEAIERWRGTLLEDEERDVLEEYGLQPLISDYMLSKISATGWNMIPGRAPDVVYENIAERDKEIIQEYGEIENAPWDVRTGRVMEDSIAQTIGAVPFYLGGHKAIRAGVSAITGVSKLPELLGRAATPEPLDMAAKAAIRRILESGGQTGVRLGTISSIFSSIRNTEEVLRGEKTSQEALWDISMETTMGTATGFILGSIFRVIPEVGIRLKYATKPKVGEVKLEYFRQPKDLQDLKNQYKELSKRYHPDRGGTEAQMKQIHAEKDYLFNKISSETAHKTMTDWQIMHKELLKRDYEQTNIGVYKNKITGEKVYLEGITPEGKVVSIDRLMKDIAKRSDIPNLTKMTRGEIYQYITQHMVPRAQLVPAKGDLETISRLPSFMRGDKPITGVHVGGYDPSLFREPPRGLLMGKVAEPSVKRTDLLAQIKIPETARIASTSDKSKIVFSEKIPTTLRDQLAKAGFKGQGTGKAGERAYIATRTEEREELLREIENVRQQQLAEAPVEEPVAELPVEEPAPEPVVEEPVEPPVEEPVVEPPVEEPLSKDELMPRAYRRLDVLNQKAGKTLSEKEREELRELNEESGRLQYRIYDLRPKEEVDALTEEEAKELKSLENELKRVKRKIRNIQSDKDKLNAEEQREMDTLARAVEEENLALIDSVLRDRPSITFSEGSRVEKATGSVDKGTLKARRGTVAGPTYEDDKGRIQVPVIWDHKPGEVEHIRSDAKRFYKIDEEAVRPSPEEVRREVEPTPTTAPSPPETKERPLRDLEVTKTVGEDDVSISFRKGRPDHRTRTALKETGFSFERTREGELWRAPLTDESLEVANRVEAKETELIPKVEAPAEVEVNIEQARAKKGWEMSFEEFMAVREHDDPETHENVHWREHLDAWEEVIATARDRGETIPKNVSEQLKGLSRGDISPAKVSLVDHTPEEPLPAVEDPLDVVRVPASALTIREEPELEPLATDEIEMYMDEISDALGMFDIEYDYASGDLIVDPTTDLSRALGEVREAVENHQQGNPPEALRGRAMEFQRDYIREAPDLYGDDPNVLTQTLESLQSEVDKHVEALKPEPKKVKPKPRKPKKKEPEVKPMTEEQVKEIKLKVVEELRKKGVSKEDKKVISEILEKLTKAAKKGEVRLDFVVEVTNKMNTKLTKADLEKAGVSTDVSRDPKALGAVMVNMEPNLLSVNMKLLLNTEKPMARTILHEFGHVWSEVWRATDPDGYHHAVRELALIARGERKGTVSQKQIERAEEILAGMMADFAIMTDDADSIVKNALGNQAANLKKWLIEGAEEYPDFKTEIFPNLPKPLVEQIEKFSKGEWSKLFKSHKGKFDVSMREFKEIEERGRDHLNETYRMLAPPFYPAIKNAIKKMADRRKDRKIHKEEFYNTLHKWIPSSKIDSDLRWSGLRDFLNRYPDTHIPEKVALSAVEEPKVTILRDIVSQEYSSYTKLAGQGRDYEEVVFQVPKFDTEKEKLAAVLQDTLSFPNREALRELAFSKGKRPLQLTIREIMDRYFKYDLSGFEGMEQHNEYLKMHDLAEVLNQLDLVGQIHVEIRSHFFGSAKRIGFNSSELDEEGSPLHTGIILDPKGEDVLRAIDIAKSHSFEDRWEEMRKERVMVDHGRAGAIFTKFQDKEERMLRELSNKPENLTIEPLSGRRALVVHEGKEETITLLYRIGYPELVSESEVKNEVKKIHNSFRKDLSKLVRNLDTTLKEAAKLDDSLKEMLQAADKKQKEILKMEEGVFDPEIVVMNGLNYVREKLIDIVNRLRANKEPIPDEIESLAEIVFGGSEYNRILQEYTPHFQDVVDPESMPSFWFRGDRVDLEDLTGTATRIHELQSDLQDLIRDTLFHSATLPDGFSLNKESFSGLPPMYILRDSKGKPIASSDEKSKGKAWSDISSRLSFPIHRIPFSHSWHEFAIKYAIRKAALEGDDAVLFTTGEIQNFSAIGTFEESVEDLKELLESYKGKEVTLYGERVKVYDPKEEPDVDIRDKVRALRNQRHVPGFDIRWYIQRKDKDPDRPLYLYELNSPDLYGTHLGPDQGGVTVWEWDLEEPFFGDSQYVKQLREHFDALEAEGRATELSLASEQEELVSKEWDVDIERLDIPKEIIDQLGVKEVYEEYDEILEENYLSMRLGSTWPSKSHAEKATGGPVIPVKTGIQDHYFIPVEVKSRVRPMTPQEKTVGLEDLEKDVAVWAVRIVDKKTGERYIVPGTASRIEMIPDKKIALEGRDPVKIFTDYLQQTGPEGTYNEIVGEKDVPELYNRLKDTMDKIADAPAPFAATFNPKIKKLGAHGIRYGYYRKDGTYAWDKAQYFKFLKNYLKQWGVKLEDKIKYKGTDGTVDYLPGFYINEKMKNDVLYKGQPFHYSLEGQDDKRAEVYSRIAKTKPVEDKPKKKPKKPKAKEVKTAQELYKKFQEKEKEAKEAPEKGLKPLGELKTLEGRRRRLGFERKEELRLAMEAHQMGKEKWVEHFAQMDKTQFDTLHKYVSHDQTPEEKYETLTLRIQNLDQKIYDEMWTEVFQTPEEWKKFTKDQLQEINTEIKDLKYWWRKSNYGKGLEKRYKEALKQIIGNVDWRKIYKREKHLEKARNLVSYYETEVQQPITKALLEDPAQLDKLGIHYVPVSLIKSVSYLDQVPLSEFEFEDVINMLRLAKRTIQTDIMKKSKYQMGLLRDREKNIKALTKNMHLNHTNLAESVKEQYKNTNRAIVTIEPKNYRSKHEKNLTKTHAALLDPYNIMRAIEGIDKGYMEKLYKGIDKGQEGVYKDMFAAEDAIKPEIDKVGREKVAKWSNYLSRTATIVDVAAERMMKRTRKALNKGEIKNESPKELAKLEKEFEKIAKEAKEEVMKNPKLNADAYDITKLFRDPLSPEPGKVVEKLELYMSEIMSLYLMGRSWKGKEVIAKYGLRREDKPVDRFVLSYADQGRLSEWLRQNHPDVVKIADKMFDHVNEYIKERLNETSMSRELQEKFLEKFYWPLIHTGMYQDIEDSLWERITGFGLDGMTQLDKHTKDGLNRGYMGQKTLEHMYFTKERKPEKGSKMEGTVLLQDAFKNFHQYVKDTAVWANLVEPVDEAKYLLDHPHFKDACRDADLMHLYYSFKSFIGDLEGNMLRPVDSLEKIGKSVISRIHSSILGVNLGVMLKQPLSLFMAATEFEHEKYLWKNVAVSRKKKKWALKMFTTYSAQGRFRDQGKMHREMGELGESAEVRRFFLGQLPRISVFTEGIRAFDRFAVGTIWLGVRDQTMVLRPDLEPDSEEFLKYVSDVTMGIVNRTQPTYTVHTRSELNRASNLFTRGLYPFSTQRNKNYNVGWRAWFEYQSELKRIWGTPDGLPPKIEWDSEVKEWRNKIEKGKKLWGTPDGKPWDKPEPGTREKETYDRLMERSQRLYGTSSGAPPAPPPGKPPKGFKGTPKEWEKEYRNKVKRVRKARKEFLRAMFHCFFSLGLGMFSVAAIMRRFYGTQAPEWSTPVRMAVHVLTTAVGSFPGGQALDTIVAMVEREGTFGIEMVSPMYSALNEILEALAGGTIAVSRWGEKYEDTARHGEERWRTEMTQLVETLLGVLGHFSGIPIHNINRHSRALVKLITPHWMDFPIDNFGRNIHQRHYYEEMWNSLAEGTAEGRGNAKRAMYILAHYYGYGIGHDKGETPQETYNRVWRGIERSYDGRKEELKKQGVTKEDVIKLWREVGDWPSPQDPNRWRPKEWTRGTMLRELTK